MPAATKQRSLRVEKDRNTLEYPALYLDVYIAGPAFEERAFAEMFARSWCTKVNTPEEADLVVFTGGQDVDPVLYGELPHPETWSSPARDKEDIAVFNTCFEQGIPMLGVCRGAQFIHVMMGGKLFQDIDNHDGTDHGMWDLKAGKYIKYISSVHHQACRKGNDGMEVLAEVAKSTKRFIDGASYESGVHQDVEAYFYRDICALGVQGHPEYAGYDYYTWWCLKKMEEYICCNPDVHFDNDNRRRLTPDDIELRNQEWTKKGKSLPTLPELMDS